MIEKQWFVYQGCKLSIDGKTVLGLNEPHPDQDGDLFVTIQYVSKNKLWNFAARAANLRPATDNEIILEQEDRERLFNPDYTKDLTAQLATAKRELAEAKEERDIARVEIDIARSCHTLMFLDTCASKRFAEIATTRAVAAEALAAERLEVIEMYPEWINKTGDYEYRECPVCKRNPVSGGGTGHAPDCRRQAVVEGKGRHHKWIIRSSILT